jgi:hypothetical protein
VIGSGHCLIGAAYGGIIDVSVADFGDLREERPDVGRTWWMQRKEGSRSCPEDNVLLW